MQFTANPWLRDAPARRAGRWSATSATRPEPARPPAGRPASCPTCSAAATAPGLLDLVQTPEQRARSPRLTAVMSLLEGHADVVMDEVGPQVIPTVAHIRERFTERRAGGGGLDRVLRRLLGLDAKMRQYRDGAAFVARASGRVGMDGLQRASGRRRRRCRCPTRSPTRPPGCAACTAEPPRSGRPAAGGRREPVGGAEPRSRPLPARSGRGGAAGPVTWCWSRAAAAPTRSRSPQRPAFEAPARRACAPGPSWSTTACSPARPPWPPRRPPTLRGLGLDPVEVVRVGSRAAGRARGRGPRRPLRRPGRRRRPARRRRRPARPHPGRPGRAGAARPRPRLGGAVAGRDAAPPAAAYRRPLLGLPGRRPRPRGRRTSTLRGTTRRTPTRPSPGSGRAAALRRARGRPRARASPRRWPAPRTCCARTPTPSTRSRPRAVGGAAVPPARASTSSPRRPPGAVRRRVLAAALVAAGAPAGRPARAHAGRRRAAHGLARAGPGHAAGRTCGVAPIRRSGRHRPARSG